MAGANVTGSDRTTVTASQVNSTGLITPITLQASVAFGPSYSNGTGANQIDLMYAAQFVIASSAHPINLTSMLDLAGAAVNMARVREFLVQVIDTSSAHIANVYASSASGWAFVPLVADQLTVPASGLLHLSDPISVGSATGLVTGSTSKILLVDSGSNSITVAIMILGCSAVS